SGCLEENPQAPSQPKLIDSTWATFFDVDTLGITVDTVNEYTLDTVTASDSIYDTSSYKVTTTTVDSIYKRWKKVDSLFYDRGYFVTDTFLLGYDTVPRVFTASSLIETTWTMVLSSDLASIEVDTVDTIVIDSEPGAPVTYDTLIYYVTSREIEILSQTIKAAVIVEQSGSFRFDTLTQTFDTSTVVEKDSVLSTATKIMPLGNSITSGDTYYNSYRRPLWHMLDSAGYEVDFVGTLTENFRGPPPNPDFDMDHEGHYGWDTGEILEGASFGDTSNGFLSRWIQEYTPDIVLLHIGTNNLDDPINQTLGDITQIIATLQSANPSVTILVAEIIQWGEGLDWIDSLNAVIPQLAQMSTSSSDVIIVDHHTGFDSRIGYDTDDETHPNEQGEIKMAQTWYDVLTGVLPPPQEFSHN
ncbi:MAG: hypothetical protein GF401_07955, partial [Chitinivibrionales bacterium]|nr:hypothetical protein [Chitinivibrionales bacterium]